jgi:hypothetical protein
MSAANNKVNKSDQAKDSKNDTAVTSHWCGAARSHLIPIVSTEDKQCPSSEDKVEIAWKN